MDEEIVELTSYFGPNGIEFQYENLEVLAVMGNCFTPLERWKDVASKKGIMISPVDTLENGLKFVRGIRFKPAVNIAAGNIDDYFTMMIYGLNQGAILRTYQEITRRTGFNPKPVEEEFCDRIEKEVLGVVIPMYEEAVSASNATNISLNRTYGGFSFWQYLTWGEKGESSLCAKVGFDKFRVPVVLEKPQELRVI